MQVTSGNKKDRERHPYVKNPRKTSFTDRALDSMLLPNTENQFSILIWNQDMYSNKSNCLGHSEALNTREKKEHPVSRLRSSRGSETKRAPILPLLLPEVSHILIMAPGT